MVWRGLSDYVISSVSRGLSVRPRQSKSHPRMSGSAGVPVRTFTQDEPQTDAELDRLGDFLKG
jgi:hypothetical protein